MKTTTPDIRLLAQETLDELFGEGLLPFKLTAYKAGVDIDGEYVVPFCDSRLHSIRFACPDNKSFKEVMRAAVLDSIGRMNGPLPSEFKQQLAASIGVLSIRRPSNPPIIARMLRTA